MDKPNTNSKRPKLSLKLPHGPSKKPDQPKAISKEVLSAAPNEDPSEVPIIRALPKPKRDSRPVIFIAVLILAIIGLSYLLAAIRVSNNKDPIPELTELATSTDKSFYTSENLQEISARASLILTKNTLNPDQLLNISVPYPTFASLATINQDDKTAIAFAYADAEENIIKTSQAPSITEAVAFLGPAASDAEVNHFITTHTVVSGYNVNKIATAYKRIFDEDLDTSKRLVINSRGNSYYEPSNKTLYFSANTDSATHSQIYKSSIIKNDKTIYVDFAFINCDNLSNFITNTITTTCEDGFTQHELTNLEEYFLNGLNFNTYNNYTHYRLIFESDGFGNYLYKTAEVIDPEKS